MRKWTPKSWVDINNSGRIYVDDEYENSIGYSSFRDNQIYRSKNFIYDYVNSEHLNLFNIDRTYHGLASARGEDIIHWLKAREVYTATNNPHEYLDMKASAKASKKPIYVQYGDIFFDVSAPGKVGILDLDTFNHLYEDVVDSTVEKMHCLDSRGTLLLWHTAGRFRGGNQRIEKNRKRLKDLVSRKWNILKYDNISYYDGIAMRVDVFTVEEK